MARSSREAVWNTLQALLGTRATVTPPFTDTLSQGDTSTQDRSPVPQAGAHAETRRARDVRPWARARERPNLEWAPAFRGV
jgi:hypothetical protein